MSSSATRWSWCAPPRRAVNEVARELGVSHETLRSWVKLASGTGRVACCNDQPEFEPWLTAHEMVDLAGRQVRPDCTPDRVADVLRRAVPTRHGPAAYGGSPSSRVTPRMRWMGKLWMRPSSSSYARR
ncbi:transposase [Carbonactinospora thermoautotrophica]|uniref:transposase n=1 Tax=Carbonactinospora thermoautotrophica TaxID=1469144 RepID=UPI00099ECB9A